MREADKGLRKEIRDLGTELRAEIKSMIRHHVIMILGLLGIVVGISAPLIMFVLTRLA